MKRPALLTLVLFLLAALFGWETRRALVSGPGGQGEAGGQRQDAWRPGVPAPDPAPPPDAAPVAAAISARPLFRADRQPFREASGSPVPARNYDAELSRFSLLGVLDFGDGLRGVVVSKAGTRTDRWELRAGDAIPGFAVKEVRADGLLLTADGREVMLPLYAGAPTASGSALRSEAPRRDAAGPKAEAAPSPAVPAPSAVPSRGTPVPAPAVAAPATAPVERPGPRIAPRYTPGRR